MLLNKTDAKILEVLRKEPETREDLAKILNLNYNTLGNHFKKLQRYGMIRQVKRGIWSLTDNGQKEFGKLRPSVQVSDSPYKITKQTLDNEMRVTHFQTQFQIAIEAFGNRLKDIDYMDEYELSLITEPALNKLKKLSDRLKINGITMNEINLIASEFKKILREFIPIIEEDNRLFEEQMADTIRRTRICPECYESILLEDWQLCRKGYIRDCPRCKVPLKCINRELEVDDDKLWSRRMEKNIMLECQLNIMRQFLG